MELRREEIWNGKKAEALAAKGKKDAKKDSIILNRTGGESSKNVPKISVFLPKIGNLKNLNQFTRFENLNLWRENSN